MLYTIYNIYISGVGGVRVYDTTPYTGDVLLIIHVLCHLFMFCLIAFVLIAKRLMANHRM